MHLRNAPLFIAATLVSLVPLGVEADGIDIVADVESLRSDRGEVRGALYASSDGWTNEGRQIATCVARVTHRESRCVFENVPPGTYAIALLHDENGDGRMDRDLFGFPQEGFAFSNDASPGLGPPSFQSAHFVHRQENTILHMHARYGL